jgi:hypothetical protein
MSSTDHRTEHVPPAGVRIERMIERVETRAAVSAIRSTVLGAGLGVVTLTAGIGAFLLVWYVLVDVLS